MPNIRGTRQQHDVTLEPVADLFDFQTDAEELLNALDKAVTVIKRLRGDAPPQLPVIA